MAVSMNIQPKGPINRSNRVKDYIRLKTQSRNGMRHCQEMLVADTVRRLRARYRANTRHTPAISFQEWLLQGRTLEGTFSSRNSYALRSFWSERLLREAGEITLGADQSLDWFANALQVQLGDIVSVRIGAHVVKGFYSDEQSLYFDLLRA